MSVLLEYYAKSSNQEPSFVYPGRMPKVSEAHKDAQRSRVLRAAQACFSKNGFHRTSMDDILAEAKMSSGALYLYFRGKDEIIEAIATAAVTQVSEVTKLSDQDFEKITTFESVVLQIFLAADRFIETGFARLALQAWGEAQTDKELKKIVAKQIRLIRANMTGLARHCQERGLLNSKISPEEFGKVIFGLLPGYVLQALVVSDISAATYAAAVSGSILQIR